MKKLILLTSLCLGAALTASAALYSYTYNSSVDGGDLITDGGLTPLSKTFQPSGITETSIMDVSVRLNISGGSNGDLYGYLQHDGVLVPLLNRVGMSSTNANGYSDAGLNVTLTDGVGNSIHFYQAVTGYSVSGGAAWSPDGRVIDSLTSPPSAFDADGTVTLASYVGMNPNGIWTLALADVVEDVGEGDESRLVSWGLDIKAVPEPVNVALGFFGGLLGVAQLVRVLRGRDVNRAKNTRGPKPAL